MHKVPRITKNANVAFYVAMAAEEDKGYLQDGIQVGRLNNRDVCFPRVHMSHTYWTLIRPSPTSGNQSLYQRISMKAKKTEGTVRERKKRKGEEWKGAALIKQLLMC